MNLPITLTGYVKTGNHIGTRFGMPTANITPAEDLAGLEFGVYFSVVKCGGTYPAITNLGTKPTVESSGEAGAETFIYGYEGDLYGKKIAVTLLEFRRSERKFPSLDELYETVRDDFRAGALYHGLDPEKYGAV
ncbi:MAG: riboflavin kinase [Lachnospiraceae bacterium]|nr:riboflavin kinase [Lachnospiraceae bacterium]